MTLNASALKTQLETLSANPPATIADCANAWGDAMNAYATAVLPPSTTVAAATATLKTALAAAFALPAAAPSMTSAFTAFATTVAAGMSPAFVGAPPPAPLGFAAQFALPFPATHADAANALGNIIHAWMVTGTATPPVGPVLNWV